jgi:Gpi18-like mannosyltransferase
MRDPARTWETNNVAYPPLYPFISRMTHALFDLSWPAALVLVANLAWIAALGFLLMIARRLRLDALWVVFLLLVFALYPVSIWLLAGYSDALSLALTFAILHLALGVMEDPSRHRALWLFVLGMQPGGIVLQQNMFELFYQRILQG